MSAEARPALWAEAFLSSMSAPGFTAKASDYGRLADISGDPRPFLGAALSSLAEGDKPAAEAWLEKALSGGASVPPELLWDCGLYEILANRSDAASGSAEIALMGDAAWMSGDVELAKRRWTRSIALGPKASWKPYANLALLSRPRSELKPRAIGRGCARPSSPRHPLPREREPWLVRAHTLPARGRMPRRSRYSRAACRPSPALQGKAVGLGPRYQAAVPCPKAAMRPSSSASPRCVPNDPMVMGAALKALSIRGMYGEVAVLREGAARRKLPLEYGWYYEAEVLAARGDYAERSAIRDRNTPSASRRAEEGAFALGGLFAAMGDHVKSAAEYSRAPSRRRGTARPNAPPSKRSGANWARLADKARSRTGLYRDALAADPGDAEAALLARSVAGK
jgi:hypothetical protein